MANAPVTEKCYASASVPEPLFFKFPALIDSVRCAWSRQTVDWRKLLVCVGQSELGHCYYWLLFAVRTPSTREYASTWGRALALVPKSASSSPLSLMLATSEGTRV